MTIALLLLVVFIFALAIRRASRSKSNDKVVTYDEFLQAKRRAKEKRMGGQRCRMCGAFYFGMAPTCGCSELTDEDVEM